MKIIPKRWTSRWWWLWLLPALGLHPGVAAAGQPPDYSGWHLPVPAGNWLITRGPCQSPTPYDHLCGYYEESCAIDLIPRAGTMEGVPVLAVAAGQVFFVGTRDDAGQTVMVLHSDGRVSGYMHLSQVAVGLDAVVMPGQVLGYAGNSGSSGGPHLHFFVQANAVERVCVPLAGLDQMDYARQTATSFNKAWSELTLPDPPAQAWPAVSVISATAAEMLASPGAVTFGWGTAPRWPVRLTGALKPLRTLYDAAGGATRALTATAQGSLFMVPVATTATLGTQVWPLYADASRRQLALSLTYTVTSPLDNEPAQGLLYLNPTLISPVGYRTFSAAPALCWSISAQVGQAPLHFRALIVGPTSADSGWISATCWQAPVQGRGLYLWKVFVRDAAGHMNRTNQRPAAFYLR